MEMKTLVRILIAVSLIELWLAAGKSLSKVSSSVVFERTIEVYPYTILFIGKTDKEDKHYSKYVNFVEVYKENSDFTFLYTDKSDIKIELAKLPKDYDKLDPFTVYLFEKNGMVHKYEYKELLEARLVTFANKVVEEAINRLPEDVRKQYYDNDDQAWILPDLDRQAYKHHYVNGDQFLILVYGYDTMPEMFNKQRWIVKDAVYKTSLISYGIPESSSEKQYSNDLIAYVLQTDEFGKEYRSSMNIKEKPFCQLIIVDTTKLSQKYQHTYFSEYSLDADKIKNFILDYTKENMLEEGENPAVLDL